MNSLIIISCTLKKDKNCFFIQVSGAEKEDSYFVSINSGEFVFKRKFEDVFNMSINERFEIIDAFCSNDTSINVYVNINNIDTSFVVNPNLIKGCFIGTGIKGQPFVFYDFIKTGMEYKFE